MSVSAGRAKGRVLAVLALAALAAAACSSGDAEAPASTSITAPSDVGSASTTAAASTTVTELTSVTSSTAPDTASGEPGPATTTQSGDRTCVVHDDLERCWLIVVPSTPDTPAPLVIDFHGWTSNAGSQRSSSGFDELAELEGFVVVWPEGYESSFNAGRLCCAPANEDGIDDVDFTRLLVSVVSEAHEIDLDRVYVTGLSNGCAMAQRVAADASDLVAAVACMSLYLLDDADPGYTPVPVMELHGTNDGVVAYEPSAFFAGAEENWSYWAELNGCTGDPAETWRSDASAARTYQTCAGGSEVSLVTIDRGGHVLYAGVGTDIDTARLAWDFMRRFEIGT